MSTFDAHPTGGRDAVQHDPASCQPFNRFWRVFHKATQQFWIVLVVTAFQGFLVEQLFAVLDALYALEACFCGVHPGRSFNGVPADGGHFLDDQHAGPFIMRLNRGRQTSTTGTDNHDIKLFRFVRIDALFCRQYFAGFQHRFGNRFFHGFALAGRAGDGIHVRGVGIKNTAADLFKAADKFHILSRARCQFDVSDTVRFETHVNH
ncbi:hypothetical protein D3C72_877090 [compost metagenome]